ncbi:phosphate system positive regulatory protein pho81, partial [Coemansia sp. RSA 2052]
AVKAGCDADEPDYYARRPIHYAAINGHEQCIEYLLEQGCSVGIIDDDGRHAFDYAVINGHSECARLLLQYDRTIANGTADQPALMLACEKGHQDIVLMLLEAGAEIVANSQGVHPAHVAARAGYADILRLLLAHCQSFDIADKDLGWTPVFYAASEGNLECIQILLDAGCDIDAVDENGHTPAYFAANEGHLDCVDLLLEAASARTKVVLDKAQLLDAAGNVVSEAAALVASAEGASGGLLASEGDVGAMMDLDLDSIPSLSLPPPLIPFRVYGHNFLGKRTRIQIRMHAHHQAGGPPIAFFDNRDMLSLKLVAIAKPDAGMVPHTVMLPLESPNTTFGFLTDDPRNFRLEFFLYPSFGLQPIGKAVALPSLFASASSGVARLPLLDRYLKLVAEISFEFLVVRPFEGAQLQIGGKVETYWKSTNPGPRQNAVAAVASAIAGFSEQSPKSQLTAGLSNTPLSSAIIGSPLSMTESGGNSQGYAGIPLVVSSSLAAEHICVQVQVCRDGVPVVCPRMLVNVGSSSGVRLRISSLTHAEFQLVMRTPSIAQVPVSYIVGLGALVVHARLFQVTRSPHTSHFPKLQRLLRSPAGTGTAIGAYVAMSCFMMVVHGWMFGGLSTRMWLYPEGSYGPPQLNPAWLASCVLATVLGCSYGAQLIMDERLQLSFPAIEQSRIYALKDRLPGGFTRALGFSFGVLWRFWLGYFVLGWGVYRSACGVLARVMTTSAYGVSNPLFSLSGLSFWLLNGTLTALVWELAHQLFETIATEPTHINALSLDRNACLLNGLKHVDSPLVQHLAYQELYRLTMFDAGQRTEILADIDRPMGTMWAQVSGQCIGVITTATG